MVFHFGDCIIICISILVLLYISIGTVLYCGLVVDFWYRSGGYVFCFGDILLMGRFVNVWKSIFLPLCRRIFDLLVGMLYVCGVLVIGWVAVSHHTLMPRGLGIRGRDKVVSELKASIPWAG